jgi:SAM-dependent methyltransferase
MVQNPDSLADILAREYFSKPMQALFRAFELRAYDTVKLEFEHPALDLGCGIGAFATVLCWYKELDGLEFGADLTFKDLQQAKRRPVYKMAFQANAQALPIKGGALKFVLCNGVLCCIYPGYEVALGEVARVLKSGGQFVMTVPTPGFTSALLPNRLFETLRFNSLAEWYCRRINARLGHRKLADLAFWKRQLALVGLRVEHSQLYFSKTQKTWWSIFATRPFQLFSLARYFPRSVQRLALIATTTLLRILPKPTHWREDECGYLIVVAKKVI